MSEFRVDRFELGDAPVEAPPPISPNITCGAVYELFVHEPDYLALAAVDASGRPVGLINRVEMLTQFSRRFWREIYERRPILQLMDRQPLVLPIDADVETVTRAIAERKTRALHSGWILTRDGSYAGIGSAMRLLDLWMQRMERRARELDAARTLAEQASEAKSRFLANVSHELRTPLNAIIGFSEIMSGQMFGPLGDPRYQAYAQDVQDSGQHLLALINEILDLSKAEAGRLELQEDRVAVDAVCDAALRLLGDRPARGGVDLRVDIDHDLPPIFADARKLTQVLVNLLSNAVKFTAAGGRITLRATMDGARRLALSVVDTGIGMRPDHLDVAFEPFGQVDTALNRKYQGTGLGLPLAKAMVELHGGRLMVDSAPGRGTVVTVLLPAERMLAAPAMRQTA